MGRDTDLTGIIREIVQFLERLGEVKLPSILENVRGDLLVRSKDALVACATVTSGPSSSPEPYLSMSPGNGSAARGLLLLAARDALTWKQDEPQEYVGAEEPREENTESQQDYYETFQDVQRPAETTQASPVEQNKRENVNATLHEIYSSFSAEQTKSKCVKCGPLRKGGKKLFLFEQHRDCWAGLVGSYLLIYGTEKDSRPCMIQSIRGSTARPAPNAIPRDPKKSESTFELFTPGNKTLQFIARSPKDMEQWIAKIARVNSYEKDDDVIMQNGKTEDVLTEKNAENVVQETYQDVGAPKNNDTKQDESTILRGRRTPVQRDETNKETGSRNGEQTDEDGKSKGKTGKNKETPPPLPARIPRRLPSLPPEKTVVAVHCDAPEDEEEDDFYHRIDDFKDMARYQNVAKKSKKTEDALESYDDVQSVAKGKRKEKETKGKDEKRKSIETKSAEVVEEIYDDVASVLREEKKNEVKEKGAGKEEISELPSYDDVQNLVVTKASKDQRRKQEKSAEESAKSPVKKSFLDRVRSGRRQQRESSGKGEKRLKRKTPTPPPATTSACEESPLYDDVSNLPTANRQEEVPEETELPEYNCPPPPRPIYVPPVAVPEVEDIYDDIGVARRRIDDELPTTMDVGSTKMSCVQMNGIQMNERNLEEIDGEHYQSPKSSMPVGEQVEELYDDIAILADFTARQREIANKKLEVMKTPSSSPEKKPWNRRFGGSRKSKCSETLIDGSMAEVNGQRSSGEIDDIESHIPEQSQKSVTRKNTFQKLINKMENSLGKASSLSPGKTNSTNDGT